MSSKSAATGEYRGFDIDTAKELATDMAGRVEFFATDGKSRVGGIVADNYDTSTNAPVSVACAEVAGFNDASFESATVPMNVIDEADATVATTLEAPAREFQAVLAGRALVSMASDFEAASLTEIHPELAIIPLDPQRAKRPGAFPVAQDDIVRQNVPDPWMGSKKADGGFDRPDHTRAIAL